MKRKTALTVVIISVFFSLFSIVSFAQSLGCCTNPGAATLLCVTERLAQDQECCPPKGSNPDYYDIANGGPENEDACLSPPFFHQDKSCGEVNECQLGCCCTDTGGELKSRALCTGTGETFKEGETDCITACEVPECSNGEDDDNNGCEDYPTDQGCSSPSDTDESGGICFQTAGPNCDNINYVPEVSNFVISPVKGEKKLALSWENECASTLIANKISRCTGQGCTDFQLIGVTPHSSFTDEDEILKFDTIYTYQIQPEFSVQTAQPVASAVGSMGDIECWGVTTNDNFCIHTAYYNKHKSYLISNIAGFTEENFVENVRNTFSDRLNKAFFCNSENTLVEEGTICGTGQVCVVKPSGAACVEESDCNPEDDNLFGLFFTQQICENNNYCFYDRSFSAVNACFACDPAMSCYDYKSQDACQRDNCQVHSCQWKTISEELGTGACVSTVEDNCNWCDKKGTEGVGSSESTSSIFEQCTASKAQLLSTEEDVCYFQNSTGSALNCKSVICTDYDEDQCIKVTPNYDQFNNLDLKSNDRCGIGTCQWYENEQTCKKNANRDLHPDCDVSDIECEQDVFAPDTTLVPVIDRGVYKSLSIQILDKAIGSSAPTLRVENNYKTFICKEPCGSEGHPYDNFTNGHIFLISNLKLYDKFTGEELFVLDEDQNTLRYYSQDPAKNIGKVKTIEIDTPSNNNGPVLFRVNVSGANVVDDIHYTTNRRPSITVSFLEDAIITSARLLLEGSEIAISPNFDLDDLKTNHVLSFPNTLNPDNYKLEINAKNEKGVFMDQVFLQDIVIDDEPPVVTQITPEEGALLQSSTISFTITFDSKVMLKSVKISNKDFTESFSSDDRQTFSGTMEIEDGNKKIEIVAEDFAGNDGTHISEFTLNANPLEISILKPSFGVSDVYTFDLVIETDNDAECKYSLNDDLQFNFSTNFTSSGGTLHTKKDFVEINDGDKDVHTLFVRCQDPLQEEKLQRFDLSVDPDAPIIETSFAFPDPVVENPRTTTFKVQTNKDAVCKYSTSTETFASMEGAFDGFVNKTFSEINTVEVTVDSDSTFSYFVACMGKSELSSEVKTITFSADTTLPITVKSNTLPLSNTSSITLAIETNKQSQCKYSATDPQVTQGTLFGGSGYSHTRILTLESGTYRYYVICRDQVAQKWSSPISIDFTIDTTSPTMLFVDDTSTLDANPEFTWRTDRIRAKWLGEDNETSVSSYLYTIEEFGTLNTILNWTMSTIEDEWVWATKSNGTLNLIPGSKYFFRVRAKNRVGLTSDAMESDGITIDPSLIPANCSNGVHDPQETDTDCGGPCSLCGEGKSCRSDADCVSAFCSSENICRGPTCTDNAKNQDESDVDCGGSVCSKCENEKSCNVDSDCSSNHCSFNFCKESEACFDGQITGTESDVDCGGACPTKCGEGSSCSIDADCVEGAKCFDTTCRVCEAGDENCNGIPDSEEGKPKDTDGDGIPDQWELQMGLDPNDGSDASSDYDNDGLTNIEEYKLRTNPNKEDSDGDGVSDKKEVDKGTDPLDPDDKPRNIVWLLLLILLAILLLAGLGAGAYYYYDQYAVKQKKQPKVAPIKRPLVIPQPVVRQMPRKPVRNAQRELYRKRQRNKRFERGKLVSIFDPASAKKSPTENLRSIAKKPYSKSKSDSSKESKSKPGTSLTRITTEKTVRKQKQQKQEQEKSDDPFQNLKKINKEEVIRKIKGPQRRPTTKKTLRKLKNMSKKTKKK